MNTNNFERLLASEVYIRQRSCENITFSKPIISLGELGVVYPNTINVIQGQKGVHKSRLTEVFASLFISQNPFKKQLGFNVAPLKQFHVLYVDTERNMNDQLPYAIQKIKVKSGFDKAEQIPNLVAISLIDISRKDRYGVLTSYLQDLRHRLDIGVHLVIILDVITDCIGSFNNIDESMQFIDWINTMINQFNVTFFCIIHENPTSFGDSKARGHLGTEIINKASQVMQIGFERGSNGIRTDLICLKFLHSRNTRAIDPLYLRYSDAMNGLILADTEFINAQKALKSEKASLPELKDWLMNNLTERISKAELIEKIKDEFACGSRIIEDRLKELTDSDITKLKIGKEVFFEPKIPF